jgi:hypothetical protein
MNFILQVVHIKVELGSKSFNEEKFWEKAVYTDVFWDLGYNREKKLAEKTVVPKSNKIFCKNTTKIDIFQLFSEFFFPNGLKIQGEFLIFAFFNCQ